MFRVSKELKGEPLVNFSWKSHNAEKIETWDPSVSLSFVCYAKKRTSLIVHSLGQKVQFGALKLCRTFGRTILGPFKCIETTDEKPWV